MSKRIEAPLQAASLQPSDYQPLGNYFDENLQPLFGTYKAFEHHLAAVRDVLEEEGALARVGRLLNVHKPTFWPKFLAAQRALLQRRRNAEPRTGDALPSIRASPKPTGRPRKGAQGKEANAAAA